MKLMTSYEEFVEEDAILQVFKIRQFRVAPMTHNRYPQFVLVEEYSALDEYFTLGCNDQTNSLTVQQQAATLCSTSYSVSQIVRLINCLHLSKN